MSTYSFNATGSVTWIISGTGAIVQLLVAVFVNTINHRRTSCG